MNSLLNLLSCCCPCIPSLNTPYLSLNGKRYKILRLLAEGGFSYVYLVISPSSNNSHYALKKIRCPFGVRDETYKNALKEVRNYHMFSTSKTPYIVQSIDEYIETERDGTRTVYILLPYFSKSLQDIINYNVLNNILMEEDTVKGILIGICRGLQVMHQFKKASDPVDFPEEEEEDLLMPATSDYEEELSNGSPNGTEMQELTPFAHRDLKPGNVMLSAEGMPVLIDLGSCSRARIEVKNRQQMLSLMDFASEHCTLPYRAPELLDVQLNTEITEKTDIWSLGCLLYTCCFGYSPFEKLEIEQGANLNVAIARGSYVIPPDRSGYSSQIIDIIHACLRINPEERPSVDKVLEMALQI